MARRTQNIGGAAPPGPGEFPLDFFPNSLFAASVRLLSSTYSGPLIRVANAATPNDLTDIFAVNGFIDTATILAIAAGGDVLCQTMFSQNGNGTILFRGNNSQLPFIAKAGAITQYNGDIGVQFDPGRFYNYVTGQPALDTQYCSIASVYSHPVDSVVLPFGLYYANNSRIEHYAYTTPGTYRLVVREQGVNENADYVSSPQISPPTQIIQTGWFAANEIGIEINDQVIQAARPSPGFTGTNEQIGVFPDTQTFFFHETFAFPVRDPAFQPYLNDYWNFY